MITYVYLMRKRGTRKCKIGIARKPEIRRRQVDRAVRGNVYLVYYRPVLFAAVAEKFLHSRFATMRFRLWQAGPGAGRTEWFHFNILQRAIVIFWIGTLSFLPVLLLLGWFFYRYRAGVDQVLFWMMDGMNWIWTQLGV